MNTVTQSHVSPSNQRELTEEELAATSGGFIGWLGLAAQGYGFYKSLQLTYRHGYRTGRR
ncbi:hypothetical protein LZC95_51030 [Pendulispora brunnea]|uniref:Bacteriocin n=1 Tax=Pendulispora brunnea TaxID=2905690 RepID=A0ABZ2K7S9_9BACT